MFTPQSLLLASLLSACGNSSPPNSACALYREVDGASSCDPIKQGAGSNAAIDTAIVHYTSGGGSGSKWCIATIDPRPLNCTIIHPSPADIQKQQQDEIDAAKAKAATSTPQTPIPQTPIPGPPFAAPAAPSHP